MCYRTMYVCIYICVYIMRSRQLHVYYFHVGRDKGIYSFLWHICSSLPRDQISVYMYVCVCVCACVCTSSCLNVACMFAP
jgi:hypothetical protein